MFHHKGQVVMEFRDYVLERLFVYGPGLDEPVGMYDFNGGGWRFHHADARGSTVALTDMDGNVIETYRYTAYGAPDQASSLGNPYLFTGRRYLADAGIYYYRARYYHPELRRFLEPDPLGYADGMNLYAYAGNNPVMYVDPYGTCRKKLWNRRGHGIKIQKLILLLDYVLERLFVYGPGIDEPWGVLLKE